MALIRRLAEHSPDAEIAMILAKQGQRTATGLPFTATRVAGIRDRAQIPVGPRRPATDDDGVSIHEAARQLGICTQTIRRWLREGLLPAEQTAPHAPWRITLSDDVRRRFLPEVPTVTFASPTPPHAPASAPHDPNQIRRGDRDAIDVTQGQRRGLRIQLHAQEQGLLPAATGETF